MSRNGKTERLTGEFNFSNDELTAVLGEQRLSYLLALYKFEILWQGAKRIENTKMEEDYAENIRRMKVGLEIIEKTITEKLPLGVLPIKQELTYKEQVDMLNELRDEYRRNQLRSKLGWEIADGLADQNLKARHFADLSNIKQFLDLIEETRKELDKSENPVEHIPDNG